MKNKWMVIAFFLFICFIGNAFADIIGKIIVRGKWGDGEKEFGLDTSEPVGDGPRIFTVSPSGDVYIADVVNNRIVVYDHNGDFLKSYSADEWINTIEVDEDGYIYYTCDGLKIINKDGELIAAPKYGGVIHLDRDKIYLISDYTSYELQLNKETNELRVLRTFDTLIGCFIMSNGVEFRSSPDSLSKTGIAHININGKVTQVKKRVEKKMEVIKKGSGSPIDAYSAIVKGTIIDGDENENVYLHGLSGICRINSKGELTGVFFPTNKDDLHLIYGIPYDAPGYVHVKNDKIYFMASTPYDLSRAVEVKRGTTNYLGLPDEEFMIIEYEFQPVE